MCVYIFKKFENKANKQNTQNIYSLNVTCVWIIRTTTTTTTTTTLGNYRTMVTKYEHIQFDKDMVIFGSINIKHEFVNWIIVNVKFYIYRTKLEQKILNKIGIQNASTKIHILKKKCLHKEFGHHGKYILKT